MNKAITDGLDLMPPAFIDGLDVWSSGDGIPGSVTYANDPNGVLVASDPDFGPCVEIFKAEEPQKIRYMGETPILPGCYLEVTARVKLMSGPFPQVRVAGFAGDANGDEVTNVEPDGPSIRLDEYGRVYTVRAIIGSGPRQGVDMVWGTRAVFGHFGLDIRGDEGAVVRIESIVVEDKTSVFHRKLMDWVDVRDYGARGDGVRDDSVAFETADAAANGGQVLVPEGTYFLGRNVTMLSPVRFEGTIIQPDDRRLILRSNFDYPSYFDAFGDETVALKKALQALFNFSDHEALDLGGRRIQLDEPIDVAAAAGLTGERFFNRRAIKNGQLSAEDTPAWDPVIVNSTGSYDPANQLVLSDVTEIETIEVGSLVEGFGVGREVYVRDKDVVAGTLTLSQPLARAQASQNYTFTRFKYTLDFSGFQRVNSFNVDGIEFLGNRRGSGINLPDEGIWWIIRNCWFTEPGARAITSKGRACQGITVDQCEFRAPDADELTQNRTSVALNVNANDAKIRDNRCIEFRHFAIIAGGGNLIIGNHFWQLDGAQAGLRTAGLIMTRRLSKSTITGNYIDSMFIEVTNEHDVDAATLSGERFGNLSIVGNIFTATRVPDWFTYIVLTPIGTDHIIDGIGVVGNSFRNFGGAVMDRVESVDTSLGNFDYSQTVDLVFEGNGYSEVRERTQSPALVEYSRSSTASSWPVSAADKLPFGCHALGADSVTAQGPVERGNGDVHAGMPWIEPAQGNGQQSVNVRWTEAVRGTVQLRIRADRPNT